MYKFLSKWHVIAKYITRSDLVHVYIIASISSLPPLSFEVCKLFFIQSNSHKHECFAEHWVPGNMLLNWPCLSFALSEAFIEPGARTQGPPVTGSPALRSYSQGFTGEGFNLRGRVLHRALVDIQQLFSVRPTVTELWSLFLLRIRFKRTLVNTCRGLGFSYTAALPPSLSTKCYSTFCTLHETIRVPFFFF